MIVRGYELEMDHVSRGRWISHVVKFGEFWVDVEGWRCTSLEGLY